MLICSNLTPQWSNGWSVAMNLKLTDKAIRNAKPATGARTKRLQDGNGLTMLVTHTGSRSWCQRLVIQGVRREMGLGSYPLVTLAEAREKAFANRRIARSGGDPRQSPGIGIPTFAEAARIVHDLHSPSISNDRYRRQWITELEQHAFPVLGTLPVDAITMQVIFAVISPIWHSKPKLARQLRQRIEKIMDWCIVQGHRPDNPANSALKAALPAQNAIVRHHDALPYRELPKAIRAILEADKPMIARLAVEFLIHTAARQGEVRGADWSEIDLESATWTIPANRMKASREHRVPLSARAIEILRATGENRTGLVFRYRGKALSDSILLRLIKDCGFQVTAHGFRSSFRDWCSDTGKNREDAEMALAHTIRNAVEAAYARSDRFDRRRALMNDWSGYLTECA